MKTVIALNQDQMGHGDRELGQKILGTLLRKSTAFRELNAIVFFNSGVKLVAADSPVIAELTLLEERGVDIIPCGTCVAHFSVQPAVGHVSDMDTVLRELDQADKVITL